MAQLNQQNDAFMQQTLQAQNAIQAEQIDLRTEATLAATTAVATASKSTDGNELVDFKRNNPSQFGGGYNPEGAVLWVEELEKIFGAMRCGEDQMISYATFMLIGDAEYWWKGTRQLLEAEGREISWETFKEKFLEKYFLESVRKAKAVEFLLLKQGGMSVRDYATKFESLAKCSRCCEMLLDENRRCRRFEGGLRQEIKACIIPLRIRSFPELVDRCTMIEEVRKPKDSRPKNFRHAKFTPNNNNNNETQYKPYDRSPGAKTNQSKFQKPYNYNKRPTQHLGCLKCGKAHKTKNCHLKRSACYRCYRCRKPGHFVRDCLKPEAELSQ